MVRHDFLKLAVVADASAHFVLAFHADKGLRPDVDKFSELMRVAAPS